MPDVIQRDFTLSQYLMLINVNSKGLRAILKDRTISAPLLCRELLLGLVRNWPQKHFCISQGLCNTVTDCCASALSKAIHSERKNPLRLIKSRAKHFTAFQVLIWEAEKRAWPKCNQAVLWKIQTVSSRCVPYRNFLSLRLESIKFGLRWRTYLRVTREKLNSETALG